MVDIKFFFFFAFLVSISISQDVSQDVSQIVSQNESLNESLNESQNEQNDTYTFGPCSITTRADNYLKCRDKETRDPNKVCCYLKMDSISRCVELEKTDIDGKDNFTSTKNKILSGLYWNMSRIKKENIDDFYELNRTFTKIDKLRCNNSKYLKSFVYFAILFIFF